MGTCLLTRSVELKADLYACKPKGRRYFVHVLETLLRALMACHGLLSATHPSIASRFILVSESCYV